MEIDLNYLQNGVLLSLCIKDDYNRFIWNVACHAMDRSIDLDSE